LAGRAATQWKTDISDQFTIFFRSLCPIHRLTLLIHGGTVEPEIFSGHETIWNPSPSCFWWQMLRSCRAECESCASLVCLSASRSDMCTATGIITKMMQCCCHNTVYNISSFWHVSANFISFRTVCLSKIINLIVPLKSCRRVKFLRHLKTAFFDWTSFFFYNLKGKTCWSITPSSIGKDPRGGIMSRMSVELHPAKSIEALWVLGPVSSQIRHLKQFNLRHCPSSQFPPYCDLSRTARIEVRDFKGGLQCFVVKPMRLGIVGKASPSSEASPEQRPEYNQTNRYMEAHWWLTPQQPAQINQWTTDPSNTKRWITRTTESMEWNRLYYITLHYMQYLTYSYQYQY
jgi:hypothetical protein